MSIKYWFKNPLSGVLQGTIGFCLFVVEQYLLYSKLSQLFHDDWKKVDDIQWIFVKKWVK